MKLDANVSLGAVARAMNVALPAKATVKSVRVTVTYRVEGQDGIISSTRKGGDRLLVRNAIPKIFSPEPKSTSVAIV